MEEEKLFIFALAREGNEKRQHIFLFLLLL